MQGPIISMDISNGSSHFLSFKMSGEKVGKVQKINHDVDGFNFLLESIQKLKEATGEEVSVVYEATGVFLYKEVENDLINKLKEVYENIANTDISSIDTMKSILHFIKENKEIYSILMIYQRDVDLWKKVNHLSVDLFLLKIYQKYPNYEKCDQNELRQTVQFITSGFYALYKNWLLDNCKEEIESLAIRLSSLSDTCIEKTIK